MEYITVQYKKCLEEGKADAALRVIEQLVQSAGEASESLVKPLGTATLECYRRLHFRPVHQLYKVLPAKIPSPVGPDLQALLEPHVKQTMQWAKRLQSLTPERRASALCELVRAGKKERALSLLKERMSAARNPEEQVKMAYYLGGVLGSLINDMDKVEALIALIAKNPAAGGLTMQQLDTLQEGVERRKASVYKEGTAGLERSFKASLTNLAVELRAQLPGKMAASTQITEQLINKFRIPLRALFGAALASSDNSRWRDLLQVLIELCPRTLSTASAQAGVEQRLYMAVSPVEQRIIEKCLFEIGQLDHAAKALLKFASTIHAEDVRRTCQVIEIMGILRSNLFLKFILEKMKQHREVQPLGIAAMGYIGSDEALNQLLRLLQGVLKAGLKRGQLAEGPPRRQVMALVTSLGRVASSPRTKAPARNDLAKKLRTMLPAEDKKLMQFMAISFFRQAAGDWSKENMTWAAETLAAGLWSDGQAQQAAAAGQKRTLLGFRQPIVDALGRFGAKCVGSLVAAFTSHVADPGGAFIACAHVARAIGDPAFQPILEKMVTTTVMAAESGKYNQEVYFDTTDEQEKPLTKDMIVSELIFAMDKINGEEGDEIMARLFEAFKSERLPHPGEQSMEVLFNARQRWSRRTGGEVFAEKKTEQAPEVVLDEKDLARLMKQLKSGLIMTAAKKTKMVEAIAQIGEAFAVEAVDQLLDLAGHKDSMVRGAATTALHRFAAIDAPKSAGASLCMSLLERLESSKKGVAEEAKNLLIELRPNREPFQSALQKIMKMEEFH